MAAEGAFYSAKIKARTNADWEVTGITYKTAAGVAIDLTGSALALRVKRNAASLVAEATAIITVTNAAAGTFDVRIPRTDLARLAPGTYYHDLLRTWTVSGVEKTEALWAGELILDGGIS